MKLGQLLKKKISEWNEKTKRLFAYEEKDFVSLDLGARYLKGALVKDGKIGELFIEKKGESASAIDFLESKGIHSKEVKFAIKGPETLIRYIPFPKVEKSKLREIFGYELSKYIPFSSEDVYFDISLLDENYSKDEFLILLAAAKKELIDSILSPFRERRVEVKEISLNNLALLNLFFHCKEKKASNTAIIDLGFSSTLLNLVKGEMPYLSREIKVGCFHLIEKISLVKNLSHDKAEEWLVTSSGVDELIKIGEEPLWELSREVKSSLDYFEMNVGENVEEFYLTGGASSVESVREAISKSLGVKLILWEAAKTLDIKAKSFSFPLQMFSTVIGLSL
ncbi:MAG TPA: hypothetical protein ENG49_02085 [Candidatus Omnitrophica bacterium]|nr:hypothetical protein [Candidatus Omnitrophota bacterium]